MSSVEAIIFDLDNVLYDYRFPERVANMAAQSGLSPAEVEERIFLSGFEEAADNGEYDLKTYIAECNRLLGAELSFAEMSDARLSAMDPDPDMLNLLRKLRQSHKLALLTNNGYFLAASLPRFFPEATELFSNHVYFSGILGLAKPDPAVYLEVCRRLDAVPGRTLFIDDSENYISGAKEAGLLVHHFKDYAGLKQNLEH